MFPLESDSYLCTLEFSSNNKQKRKEKEKKQSEPKLITPECIELENQRDTARKPSLQLDGTEACTVNIVWVTNKVMSKMGYKVSTDTEI